MGLSKDILHESILDVAASDAHVKRAVASVGLPDERVREPGFASMLRILVGQQLSVKAAASIWAKFEDMLGTVTPDRVLSYEFDALRGAGLSKQKVIYAQALSQAVLSGALDFDTLSELDEEDARANICAVKGFGPWSAEIYLLFCDGRGDIWPAGDLALQAALQRMKGLDARPTAKDTYPIVDPWRPHRGAMAVFLWHYYAQSDAPV